MSPGARHVVTSSLAVAVRNLVLTNTRRTDRDQKTVKFGSVISQDGAMAKPSVVGLLHISVERTRQLQRCQDSIKY